MSELLLYVGTYTSKGSVGIYGYRFDPAADGALERAGEPAELPNPTFLAVHPREPVLYSVSEVRDEEGRHGGSINAFRLDGRTGRLEFLDRQSSEGAGPCHLCVDRDGRFVLAANYASGSAAILPVEADGRLSPASDVAQHEGSSVNPDRQEGPHAHSVTLSPDNRYAFVADLGLDRIMSYRLDAEPGRLAPNDPPWAETRRGAGPRHCTFHPNGRFFYAITELGNTVAAFDYDAASGALRATGEYSALPAGFEGESYCADLHVSRSGRFLYGSNRGHDSIAVFAIDGESGGLTPVGHESTQGKWPRNFAIDPSGEFLLAANQDSDSIVVFRLDHDTGMPMFTGRTATVSMPVCLRFVAR